MDNINLPYYRIEKTQEGKEFFFSHVGYFNFWNQYLMLNLGFNNCYFSLVNRPHTIFHGVATDLQKEEFQNAISCSYMQQKPKEMFDDFPELTYKALIKILNVLSTSRVFVSE